MANQLNIQVGADVSGAISGLNQLETKTAKAFGEVKRASGAAQATVINFGRVIQDAPYAVIAGNIGAIANNIDPLVESFGRARAQGGSFGGTLKEIGKSLIGPAGIGLAISAVTSALVLWGGRSKQAKSDTDDFAKSLQNAKAQAVSTGLQLQQFVDTAKNSTLPLEQRNEALRKANEILGKYGETLTLTNIATAKATELVKNYTEGLTAQALANQFADRAATLLIKQSEAQSKVTKAQDEYNKAQQAFINRPALSVRDQELGRGLVFITQRDQALKNLTDAQTDYSNVTKEVVDIQKQFNEQAQKSTSLLGAVGTKAKEVKVEDFDFIAGIQAGLKGFEDALKVTLGRAIDIGRIKIAVSGIAFEPKPSFFEQLQSQTSEKIAKAFPDAFQLRPAIVIDPEKVELGKRLVAQLDSIKQAISNSLVSGIEAVGESIGNALSGQDFGKSILQVFSGFLQAIGQALIKFGIVKEGLDKILGPGGIAIPGAAAIGLGVLAIASAQLVKNFGGAREKGGPVSGNKTYLVGERGPELFVPSVGGSIVPNNQLGSFGGRPAFAMGGGGGGRSIVRGTDILLASARTQRSISRVNA
jgi:hypothetical protein